MKVKNSIAKFSSAWDEIEQQCIILSQGSVCIFLLFITMISAYFVIEYFPFFSLKVEYQRNKLSTLLFLKN